MVVFTETLWIMALWANTSVDSAGPGKVVKSWIGFYCCTPAAPSLVKCMQFFRRTALRPIFEQALCRPKSTGPRIYHHLMEGFRFCWSHMSERELQQCSSDAGPERHVAGMEMRATLEGQRWNWLPVPCSLLCLCLPWGRDVSNQHVQAMQCRIGLEPQSWKPDSR